MLLSARAHIVVLNCVYISFPFAFASQQNSNRFDMEVRCCQWLYKSNSAFLLKFAESKTKVPDTVVRSHDWVVFSFIIYLWFGQTTELNWTKLNWTKRKTSCHWQAATTKNGFRKEHTNKLLEYVICSGVIATIWNLYSECCERKKNENSADAQRTTRHFVREWLSYDVCTAMLFAAKPHRTHILKHRHTSMRS